VTGAPEDTPAPTARTGPVLAVFAHPDDAEISAGGTLTKWAAAGREVHLLVLTNGDRGSGDAAADRAALAATRLEETKAGAVLMGLASARVLDVHDGELENTLEVRGTVVRRIREVRAETVLSVDPTAWFFENRYYNHTDHRRAGEIALDAAFPGAGNPHFYAEHLDEGLEIAPITDVWLGWTNEPNHHEDVSGHFRTKVDALAAHASQLTEGIAFFETFLQEDARSSGEKIGVEFAESFRLLDLSE
jgi:LmbE family N-acetylglucosaminyl deacetylase